MFLPRVASRLEASKNNRVPSFSYSRRIKTTQKGVDFVVFVFFYKNKIKDDWDEMTCSDHSSVIMPT